MRDSTTHTLVTFYEGTDGPTILLKMMDVAGVRQLRDAIATVRDGGEPVRLAESAGMRFIDIEALDLWYDERGRKPRLGQHKQGTSFSWVCTAEEWETVYELLEPLANDEQGHQYLTDGNDDAVVVVSLHEPDEGRWLLSHLRADGASP